MKKRSPNMLFVLALAFSFVVFSYLNWCPSTSEALSGSPSSLLEVSRGILRIPEFEMVMRFAEKVIDFVRP